MFKKTFLLTLLLTQFAVMSQEQKKILAVGTSITQGCSYVKNASEANGYFAYNKAIGSSGICLNSGILNNGRDGKDLSETIEEKVVRYGAVVDSITLERYKKYSWENVIKPYLDGTIDVVDAIWFDHGYNDRDQIYAELDKIGTIDWEISEDQDRSTFSGAFKYLLYQIFKLKPDVQIIISGFLEAESDETIIEIDNSFKGGKGIKQMHEEIAKVYAFPLLRTWEYTGFNFYHIPNSKDYIANFNKTYGTSYEPRWTDEEGNITFFQYYNPDTIHPFKDLTGRANERLDKIFTKLLKDLL